MKMKLEGERKLRLMLAAGGLFLLAFYFCVHLPLRDLCEESCDKAAKIQEEVLAVQNFHNAHLEEEEYRKELTERLERAEQALPPHLGQGEFLGRIQRAALGTNLKLEQALPQECQTVEECVALPVQLRVAGDYFQLLDFLQRLRGEDRFYQLRQMKVRTAGDGGKLEADILLVMFAEEM